MKQKDEIRNYEFLIGSIYCVSCEMVIENKLKELDSVEEVLIDYKTGIIKLKGNLGDYQEAFKKVNQIINQLGYHLKPIDSDVVSLAKKRELRYKMKDLLIGFFGTLLIVFIFYLLSNLKLFNFNFDLTNPFSYFVLGLLASFSSCAAVVGTILISLISTDIKLGLSKSQLLFKQVLFHLFRFLGFASFGGLLGIIGEYIEIYYILSFITTAFILSIITNYIKIKSVKNLDKYILIILYFIFYVSVFLFILGFFEFLSNYLTINLNSLSFFIFISLISFYLLILSLNILGIVNFKLFNLRFPKFIEKRLLNGYKTKGVLSSIFLGMFSFFLPCGFTITAQNGALLSGSFMMGAIFMFMFSLGTFPLLALISFTSLSFTEDNYFKKIFLIISAFLMIFVSIYNFFHSLRIIGFAF